MDANPLHQSSRTDGVPGAGCGKGAAAGAGAAVGGLGQRQPKPPRWVESESSEEDGEEDGEEEGELGFFGSGVGGAVDEGAWPPRDEEVGVAGFRGKPRAGGVEEAKCRY